MVFDWYFNIDSYDMSDVSDSDFYQWYLIIIGVIWDWPKFFGPKWWIFRPKFVPKFGFQLIYWHQNVQFLFPSIIYSACTTLSPIPISTYYCSISVGPSQISLVLNRRPLQLGAGEYIRREGRGWEMVICYRREWAGDMPALGMMLSCCVVSVSVF